MSKSKSPVNSRKNFPCCSLTTSLDGADARKQVKKFKNCRKIVKIAKNRKLYILVSFSKSKSPVNSRKNFPWFTGETILWCTRNSHSLEKNFIYVSRPINNKKAIILKLQIFFKILWSTKVKVIQFLLVILPCFVEWFYHREKKRFRGRIRNV